VVERLTLVERKAISFFVIGGKKGRIGSDAFHIIQEVKRRGEETPI
jgi:hypothetical protein